MEAVDGGVCVCFGTTCGCLALDSTGCIYPRCVSTPSRALGLGRPQCCALSSRLQSEQPGVAQPRWRVIVTGETAKEGKAARGGGVHGSPTVQPRGQGQGQGQGAPVSAGVACASPPAPYPAAARRLYVIYRPELTKN